MQSIEDLANLCKELPRKYRIIHILQLDALTVLHGSNSEQNPKTVELIFVIDAVLVSNSELFHGGWRLTNHLHLM
jgi:hypothetical protein